MQARRAAGRLGLQRRCERSIVGRPRRVRALKQLQYPAACGARGRESRHGLLHCHASDGRVVQRGRKLGL